MGAFGIAALAGLLALLTYAASTWALFRRYRLDDGALERLEVELPTLGHHIALSHHPAAERRYAEPLILCHGLGANRFNLDFCEDGRGRDRLSLARFLARAGFDVWVLETRGSGRAKVPKGAIYSADDQAREDVPTAIETVLHLTGAEQVIWVGHSWGGLLAYLFLGSDHPLVQKVKALVTVGSPGSVQHHQVPNFLLGIGRWLAKRGRAVPVTRYARLGLMPAPLLTWLAHRRFPKQATMRGRMFRHLCASLAENINPGQVRQMLLWRDRGEIVRMDGESYEARYPQLHQPMLLLAAPIDPLAPPEAVRSVRDRVGSKDVTFKVMSRAEGCTVDFGHGGLLVAEEAPDEVYPLIRDWLSARAKQVV